MIRKLLATTLILGGMLTAAHADTWVFKDTLRPGGQERSMATKRADGVKCGAARSGQSFNDAKAPNMRQCMSAHGWALDHVIPDPPTRRARYSRNPYAPVDNSSNDDGVRRQQDQDNLQQMNNTQQMINNQQMQNDQQQQQIVNDMNR